MTKRLIGLDGEMSDSELADGAVLVQIGVAFDAAERFRAVLGWPEDFYFKTDRAMAVHGIKPSAVAAADPPAEVDAQLERWMLARGADTNKRALVPVRLQRRTWSPGLDTTYERVGYPSEGSKSNTRRAFPSSTA